MPVHMRRRKPLMTHLIHHTDKHSVSIAPASACLRGEVTVPGDKSISHRAVMFGSLAEGTTEVTHFLQGEDCLSTIRCFSQMGVAIENTPEKIIIHGKGLRGLAQPSGLLDTGNSGTTTRLISGILAGQSFETILNGDASLRTRPMGRIIRPLTQMGADIVSLEGNDRLPLRIRGGHLSSINYQTGVASAQVKSCILLAGLYADAPTTVTEPALSRNHTELMLSSFGADIRSEGLSVTVQPEPRLRGQKVSVPGDISSAAYFIAAALLIPGSEVLVRNVGINPTRDGFLKVCRAMGADITEMNVTVSGGEPVADLLVRSSSLHGTVIEGSLIPTLIDEIPMIAVMAAFAEGQTIISDAAELKVKESDRIKTVTENLQAMGADIIPTDDGMLINSLTGHPRSRGLHSAQINSYLDHRIAMSFAVAALAADPGAAPLPAETIIHEGSCVNISYPTFYEDLEKLLR